MTQETISADEFQALEEKVHRAVEIVRRERELRAAAEAQAAEAQAKIAEAEQKHATAETETAALRAQLDQLTTASNATQSQITTLHSERDQVRQRVEKMLQQMDELL